MPKLSNYNTIFCDFLLQLEVHLVFGCQKLVEPANTVARIFNFRLFTILFPSCIHCNSVYLKIYRLQVKLKATPSETVCE